MYATAYARYEYPRGWVLFIVPWLLNRLPVDGGGSGMVAESVLPRIEGEEGGVVIANIPKGVIESGKMHGVTVI